MTHLAHNVCAGDHGCCSRLGFLGAAVAAAGTSATFFPTRASAQPAMPRTSGRSRVVLLGTVGGPGIRGVRNQPATAVIVDDVPYIVDCGNGVARQMFAAGIPIGTLNTIFVTHHHSDHIADYGALLLLAWGNGLKGQVRTYGPPPLAAMTDALFTAYARDIEVRMADEGRPPLRPLVRVTEIDRDGVVHKDERVTVTAAVVNHGAMKPSLAFRFDTPDRSIVISGDTTYDANLIRLAKDADVLVHEAMYVPALDKLLGLGNNAPTLRDHLLSSHTTTDDVGRVAAHAGVKSLALTHLVPGADASITDDLWLAGVRRSYGGPALVGHDLLVI